MKSKKVAVIDKGCVACGSCLKVCPLKAISITDGIRAVVNGDKCVGCGKCSKVCPGSFIDIMDREAASEE